MDQPRTPMARVGLAERGRGLKLLANHFRVDVGNTDSVLHHYDVDIKYSDDDETPVTGKGRLREIMDRIYSDYKESFLGDKDLAYDGEKSLFTIGPLPTKTLTLPQVIFGDTAAYRKRLDGEDGTVSESEPKRQKCGRPVKTYNVKIKFAAEVPLQAIAMALRGRETENSQEALRVLDIILRQNAAKQGCLLVKQSFFRNSESLYVDLGGGVGGLRGFHSSFRSTQGQGGGSLSLNMDVSTTMIVKPGPLVDFLIANQGVRDPFHIDFDKAKRTVKNLRISTTPNSQEFKICGFSELNCNQQMFTLKKPKNRNAPADTEDVPEEITVSDYFRKHKKMELKWSDRVRCVNVGKPNRPTYIPLELCSLLPLQRYTKSLSTLQRTQLVEKSRQKPADRRNVIEQAMPRNKYDEEPMLQKLGIRISKKLTELNGRVLEPPRLIAANGRSVRVNNGRWNYNNMQFIRSTKVEHWAIVNFSARCDMRDLVPRLLNCSRAKGIHMEEPGNVIQEDNNSARCPPITRVEKMFQKMFHGLPGRPTFVLCVLPERKNSPIYGPWKRKCLSDDGIYTQCIAPQKINDQYLTNVLLKINAKLGGINSLLQVEDSKTIPLISKVPTLILGMDVSHGSPGQTDVPSVAAVVSSLMWPLITKYRATVRTQSPKVELIDSLFKVEEEIIDDVPRNVDNGIIKEALTEFYWSSGNLKPQHVIIFRDGVSESQFSQVLNIEFNQIIEACNFIEENYRPKFTLIIAQKNHHTRFFQPGSNDNVPPGTIVDTTVCHPRNNDFYMCAQNGPIGTTRPTHYHVLIDEIKFLPDDLQELVHSLSYVYQRSTTAISVVAPICYAHLAASQMGQFINPQETISTHGINAPADVQVQQLPKLHKNVKNSMFFC